jgi:hypothetical protein
VRHALQAFREFADVLVEIGNDETAGAAVNRDIEADLLDRTDDQDALTLLMSGPASAKPAEYGSNITISTPSPGASSFKPLDVEVPNAVFSKITATFGLSPTNFDICSCALANCEARANGVKV